MENLPEEIVFSALAQASDAAIFSEYARRMSARRNRKSGGVVWIKHQPNAKLGCRCAKCWQSRQGRPGKRAARGRRKR